MNTKTVSSRQMKGLLKRNPHAYFDGDYTGCWIIGGVEYRERLANQTRARAQSEHKVKREESGR